MSPPSKSKSKEKLAVKATKEQPKANLKPSAAANGGSSIPASAYNPLSGTFHTIETVQSASSPTPQSNGRFRTIDETEDHSGSSLGTAAEYDSVSNNDSCSGESEDQQKEKIAASVAPRTESIPGSDTDKRDKIRQKNERKHQRQRERRAQELHERCCGYLMSRKLEALAQKLVAMGFTAEQATMALIQNEGRIEDSAIWLLEGGEESKRQAATNFDGVNLKIDIADELATIASLELKFKCPKQDVERAVVACEGDLEKAKGTLKAQKQEPTVALPKLEEAGSHPVASANGFHNNTMAASTLNSVVRTQVKGLAPVSIQQHRRDERDFNYTKANAITGDAQTETTNSNLQSLRKAQLKADWVKQVEIPLERKWPSTISGPLASFPLASPSQSEVAPAKSEGRYANAGVCEKGNNLLAGGTLREPIIMMQRPQSSCNKQNFPSTSISGLSASLPASMGWYPNGISSVDMMKLANGGLGHHMQNLNLAGSNPQQFYPQKHHQPFISCPVESGATSWGSSWSTPGTTTRTSSSSLAMPSSLGLFTGWASSGPSGSSSPVDWTARGSMPQCDYTSIDWSLDSTPLTPSSLSSVKGDRLCDHPKWHHHTSYMAAQGLRRPLMNGGGGGGGVCLAAQDGSLVVDPSPAAGGGSHEWTSPFAGKDIFRVPRQFVTSPSP